MARRAAAASNQLAFTFGVAPAAAASAPPPPERTCASCGRALAGTRCGRCDSATPDPHAHAAAYTECGRDSSRTLRAYLELRGVRPASIAVALEWLLADTPIEDEELRRVITAGYVRKYIPKTRWFEAVEAARAGRPMPEGLRYPVAPPATVADSGPSNEVGKPATATEEACDMKFISRGEHPPATLQDFRTVDPAAAPPPATIQESLQVAPTDRSPGPAEAAAPNDATAAPAAEIGTDRSPPALAPADLNDQPLLQEARAGLLDQVGAAADMIAPAAPPELLQTPARSIPAVEPIVLPGPEVDGSQPPQLFQSPHLPSPSPPKERARRAREASTEPEERRRRSSQPSAPAHVPATPRRVPRCSRDLVIESEEGRKSRSFRATLLSYVMADGLWDGGATDTGEVKRPVLAVFAGTEQTLRPFAVNLRLGRRALEPRDKNYGRKEVKGVELLRSGGYEYKWQHEGDGSLVTAYQGDLFAQDTGMVDPEGIRFVMLPSADWAAAQRIDEAPILQYAMRLYQAQHASERAREAEFPDRERLRAMIAPAHLLALYLDRRTRAPLIADGRFYLQLYVACLREGLASTSLRWDGSAYDHRNEKRFGIDYRLGYVEAGIEDVGFLPGCAFQAKHAEFERVLAAEVAVFSRIVGGIR